MVKYVVDDDIRIQFFRKPNFLPYFINYIKQETFSNEIQIEEMNSENDEPLGIYAIKLSGEKQQNRIVRNFIKNLFETIKSKKYHQNNVKKWFFNSTFIDIIQHILDNECHLFTVCQFCGFQSRTLEIYYFDDEKFNSFQNPIEIENILQNQILQENILSSWNKNWQIIEYIDMNTHKILSKYQICPTKAHEEDLNQIINQYERNNLLISITRDLYFRNSRKEKHIIRIFGYHKLVNEVSQKFYHLFDIYQLRKFKFDDISLDQVRLYFIYRV